MSVSINEREEFKQETQHTQQTATRKAHLVLSYLNLPSRGWTNRDGKEFKQQIY